MTQDKLLASKNVQDLAKVLDLEVSPHRTLNVCDYEMEDGFIVINEIEVLDQDGVHIKYADLGKVLDHLHNYHVTFSSNG